MKGLGRAGWYAGRFQTLVSAVITVVALDCLFCDRIKIDGPIGTSFGTSSMSAAKVVIDRNRAARLFVDCPARTGLQAGRVFAVLARHGQKQPSNLGVFSHVLVDGLPDVVSQGNIIF